MIKDHRLNTVISEQMKLFNAFSGKKVSRSTLGKVAITLSPVFPYMAEQIWQSCGNKSSVFTQLWPKPASKGQVKQIPVLINQKFVANIPDSGDEATITAQLKENQELWSKISNHKYRLVYKPSKVVNILVD